MQILLERLLLLKANRLSIDIRFPCLDSPFNIDLNAVDKKDSFGLTEAIFIRLTYRLTYRLSQHMHSCVAATLLLGRHGYSYACHTNYLVLPPSGVKAS